MNYLAPETGSLLFLILTLRHLSIWTSIFCRNQSYETVIIEIAPTDGVSGLLGFLRDMANVE